MIVKKIQDLCVHLGWGIWAGADGPRHPLLVMYKLPNLQTKPLGRIPKQIDQET